MCWVLIQMCWVFTNVMGAYTNVLGAYTNVLGAYTNVLGAYTNALVKKINTSPPLGDVWRDTLSSHLGATMVIWVQAWSLGC